MLYQVLQPLAKYVRHPNAVEVMINEPGRVFVETPETGPVAMPAPELDLETFRSIARILSHRLNIEDFWRKPYLAAALPADLFGQRGLTGAHRLQLCLGTTVPSGVAMSMRLFTPRRFTLDNYKIPPTLAELKARKAARQVAGTREAEEAAAAAGETLTEMFLRYLKAKKNIVISAGTFAGKTQFLNAVAAHVPNRDRTIIIEDTEEVDASHLENVVRFVVNRLATSEEVTNQTVIDATTRLRPDRVWLGELTMENSWMVLRLLNTGHGGMLATVHADSPELAFDAIIQNILLTKPGMDPRVIETLLKRTIDMVIQVVRVPGTYEREISDVYIKEAA